jgi:GDPmannose 4,6-dehydratase
MTQPSRTALICGISGQDGAYLAQLLLGRGYRVVGTSRDALVGRFHGLVRLGIRDRVEVCSMAMNDFRSVLQTLNRVVPDEVYNLAGQSSVGLSFEQPVETVESVTIGTLNLLEGIRFTGRNIRLYNAGSSECFGNSRARPNETTSPRSPMPAKAAAFWQVANREAYVPRLQRHPVQPRITSPAGAFCHPEDHQRRPAHFAGEEGTIAPGEHLHRPRLGLGAGIR